MASEHMSQEEIDALTKDIMSGELHANQQPYSGKDINEAHAVKTALERLYFAQENNMDAEEVRYRSWYLKNAAHALWLKRNGYTKQAWQSKVKRHFALHPEHYQLFLLNRMYRGANYG